MNLAEKEELESDAGQWFGPNAAAGANGYLAQSFPNASPGISVAVGEQIFQTYPASHPPAQSPRRRMLSRWGGRVVVVVWLNIDGANPICYETIKLV